MKTFPAHVRTGVPYFPRAKALPARALKTYLAHHAAFTASDCTDECDEEEAARPTKAAWTAVAARGSKSTTPAPLPSFLAPARGEKSKTTVSQKGKSHTWVAHQSLSVALA